MPFTLEIISGTSSSALSISLTVPAILGLANSEPTLRSVGVPFLLITINATGDTVRPVPPAPALLFVSLPYVPPPRPTPIETFDTGIRVVSPTTIGSPIIVWESAMERTSASACLIVSAILLLFVIFLYTLSHYFLPRTPFK